MFGLSRVSVGFLAGKSSIVQQFVEKTFSEDYEPTLLNTHNVTFRVGGVTFDLEVLETAGQVCCVASLCA